jgi:hypothetical protein
MKMIFETVWSQVVGWSGLVVFFLFLYEVDILASKRKPLSVLSLLKTIGLLTAAILLFFYSLEWSVLHPGD